LITNFNLKIILNIKSLIIWPT